MKTILRIAMATMLAVCSAGMAQEYPSRPVKVVIPFGPGSLPEAVARLIQPAMEEKLGQRIVIEHRPGAGGNLGAQAVLSAPADGYTLMMAATNNLVINQFLFADLKFDPLADFTPISLIAEVPLVMQVNPGLPVHDLRQFIEHAKANPGKLNYGSPSPGTIPHLAMEIFVRAAGIDIVHVPFKGGGEAVKALVANDIQSMLVGYAGTAGQVRGGRIRALAVASGSRLPALPDVPTIGEAGFPELQAAVPSNWWGMVAPKATPSAIVQRLSRDIRSALADMETRRKYSDLGLIPLGSTPSEFADALPGQARKWQAVISSLGTKPQ